MRFREQALFKYDPDEFSGFSLEDILNTSKHVGAFPIGGLADFDEMFQIIREYYSNYPAISFRELRTATGENPIVVDELWHEPASLKLDFNRSMKLRAKIDLGEDRIKHSQTGISKTYDLKLFLGLPILHDADYWPRIGDELSWRGTIHTISQVKIAPTDYFQQSALPLHVTVEALIKQTDGMVPHITKSGIAELHEKGKPVDSQPDFQAPPLNKPDDW